MNENMKFTVEQLQAIIDFLKQSGTKEIDIRGLVQLSIMHGVLAK